MPLILVPFTAIMISPPIVTDAPAIDTWDVPPCSPDKQTSQMRPLEHPLLSSHKGEKNTLTCMQILHITSRLTRSDFARLHTKEFFRIVPYSGPN
jgi:hypothetical protein